MTNGKIDYTARYLYGQAYDGTPKSAFATLAFYLAERLAGGEEEALEIIQEELSALVNNNLVTKAQAKALLTRPAAT